MFHLQVPSKIKKLFYLEIYFSTRFVHLNKKIPNFENNLDFI